jgi:hypothetical protein
MTTKRLSLRTPIYVAASELFLCAGVLAGRVFYVFANAAMWPYFVTFVAVAVFPLALAAYGGHLAAIAMPELTRQRRVKLIVWGLALFGTALFGVSQIIAYRSDSKRDTDENGFKTKVLGGLQKIIDEPDTSTKKLDASALKAILTASPVERPARGFVHPSAPAVIEITPNSTGNLKERAIALGNEILDDLFKHGWRNEYKNQNRGYLQIEDMPDGRNQTAYGNWRSRRR